MDKNISITVPMDYHALTQASRMFRGLAEDLAPAGTKAEEVSEKPAKEVTPDVEAITQLKEDAGTNIPAPGPEAVFAQPAVKETSEDILEPVAELEPTPVANNVELDSEGLPWDNRIHASSKAFLAKGGGWKKKRGIDPAIVATVEAELRQLMSTQAPTAETAAPDATPPPPATTNVTPPPAPAGSITTFPDLMAAITASGIDQAIVKGACEAVGVTAFPLLAARPDLIPAVAERLGL